MTTFNVEKIKDNSFYFLLRTDSTVNNKLITISNNVLKEELKFLISFNTKKDCDISSLSAFSGKHIKRKYYEQKSIFNEDIVIYEILILDEDQPSEHYSYGFLQNMCLYCENFIILDKLT